MYCRLLTQYAIIMVQFLAGLRKIKLHAGAGCFKAPGQLGARPVRPNIGIWLWGKKASKSGILDKDESMENENNIVVQLKSCDISIATS